MEIVHRTVEANGVRMHLAECGEGPAVLLCHGFPEGWYSWRHQLRALGAAGFRAIAPDMRGYGRTEAPPDVADYTLLHLVGDMVGVLDALDLDGAAVAGHDWGAPVAWNAALMRPDRFRAVAGLSVPYAPRGPVSGLEAIRRAGRHRFYQLHFQAPGVAEAELERDPEATIRRTLWSLSGDALGAEPWKPDLPEEGWLASTREPPALPPWLTAEDVAHYADAFRRTGFRGGLNWYRNLDRNWALLAPFHGAPIRVPALFVAGRRDPVLGWAGRALEALPRTLPALRETVLIETAGHWVQQEAPEEVNAALIRFLRGLG